MIIAGCGQFEFELGPRAARIARRAPRGAPDWIPRSPLDSGDRKSARR